MKVLKALLIVSGLVAAQNVWAQESSTDASTASSMPVAAQSSEAPSNQQAVGAAKTVTVPVGTKVVLSLKSGINTKTAKPGDGVYLISTFPVVVGNRVVIPPGVYVQGVLDRVQRAGRIKGRAQVGMHFTSMIFPNGSIVEIPGVVDSLPGSGGPKVKDQEGTVEQAGNKGKDAKTIGEIAMEGASVGSIAGAVNGSPGKGAIIGGLGGAAVGGLVTLFTRGDDLDITQGTTVEMVLQRPLLLQEVNLEGNGNGFAQPGMVPVAGQQQPLNKPKRQNHILCPPGGLGCN